MTGERLLFLALALLGEPHTSASDYSDYSLAAINILLAECFPVENSIRAAGGDPPLEQFPVLENLQREIPYNEGLLTACMSYGLAAKLILEDDDYSKFNYFSGMYTQGQDVCRKAVETPVYDRYGGFNV